MKFLKIIVALNHRQGEHVRFEHRIRREDCVIISTSTDMTERLQGLRIRPDDVLWVEGWQVGRYAYITERMIQSRQVVDRLTITK